MIPMMRLSAVLAVSSSVAAMTLTVGQTFITSGTDPTSGSNGWALTSHGVSEKLFTVNKDDEIVGQIADSVAKKSEKVWEVTLKSGYKFSDGTAVDAEHVAKCLTELNKENSAATSSLGDMTVTAVDSLKVRIESTRVTHVMDAVLAEWVFAIYRKDAAGNFIFTGPYVIESIADDHIDLTPNTFYDAEHTERAKIALKKFADGDALADALENNQVDIAFHLPIHALPKLRKEGLRVKSFEVGYHYMAFHNMDTLQDVRVRQAIDKIINRVALSQALAGGNPTRSLFPDFSPYFLDGTNMHGDDAGAGALLDAAGWVLQNGKRVKDGDELTVRLVAYPHRPGLVIMQPVIAQQLEALGITVTTVLTTMDWSTTQKIIDDRSFDLLLWAQHTLPAGDPLWFLSNFFRSDGGNNHGNLKSATVDGLLDQVSVAEEHSARVAATEAAHKAILAEVPVSNLVTPFWHVGLSDRMADYKPFGSDYYVIRSDLRCTSWDYSGEKPKRVLCGTMEKAIEKKAKEEAEKAADDDELKGGYIALIVIAGVVALGALAFIGYMVSREKQGKPLYEPAPNPLDQVKEMDNKRTVDP